MKWEHEEVRTKFSGVYLLSCSFGISDFLEVVSRTKFKYFPNYNNMCNHR